MIGALFLLFSCRRFSDLLLLDSGPDFCVISDSSVAFQLCFSLKQDRPSHASPPICFLLAPDEVLGPMRHARRYSEVMSDLRSSAFFITTLPHHAAAEVTLRQWFSRVLQEAVVSASPGSTHAAVASFALSQGLSPNSIMEAADLSSSRTLFQNYIRLIPADALRRSGEGVIQDVLSGH